MLVERTLMALLVGVMLFFFVLGFVGIYIQNKREKVMPDPLTDDGAEGDDTVTFGGR